MTSKWFYNSVELWGDQLYQCTVCGKTTEKIVCYFTLREL